MSYEINRRDGTVLATVRDGVIRRDVAPVSFIGRGSLSFGDAMNENFLHLLENFANTTAPLTPIRGQLWYDTTETVLKFYDGSLWKTIATSSNNSITVGDDNNGSTLGADGILKLYRSDGLARIEFRDTLSGPAGATLRYNAADGSLRILDNLWVDGILNVAGVSNFTNVLSVDYGTGYAVLRNGKIEIGNSGAGLPVIEFSKNASPNTLSYDARFLLTGNDLDTQFDDPAGMLRVNGFEVFHRGNFDPSGTSGFTNPITVSGGLPAGSFTTIGNDGTIELCRTDDTPRIDFKNSPLEDYDIRLQKTGNFLHVLGLTSDHGIRIAAGTANGTNVTLKQDGGIEITKTTGDAYIDFKNAETEDFDVRLHQVGVSAVLNSTGNLSVSKASAPCMFVNKPGVQAGGWAINGADFLAAVRTNEAGGFLATYFTLNPTNLNAVFSNDITAFSDAKLKTDVETISNALEIVENLRGVRYTKIATGTRGIGVIAQETQPHVPEVVHDSDGTLAVSYGNMAGLFIESDKELAKMNRALKSEIDTLKELVNTLVQRINILENK